jgi:flavin reductase (DIM6/NTAB) family NADH-FMN oxidoreductase RutF
MEPEATFNSLVGELDYPMFIVTTVAGGDRAGCLIGFASQASIHPSRFLACLSVKNHTTGVAARAQHLAVHFLPADREDLAELFGGTTGDEVDKFALCDWPEGPHGVPLVDGCVNRFVGRILERLDLGDHVGHLLAPIDGQAGRGERPLTFHRARRIEPGHAP